jgi:hypothetical protein
VFQDTLSHNQTLFLESRITSSLMQGRVVVCMSRSANVFGCSTSTAADLLGGTMMVGWRRGFGAAQPARSCEMLA